MKDRTRKVKAVPQRRFELTRATELLRAPIDFGTYRWRAIRPEEAQVIGNLLALAFRGGVDDSGESVQKWRNTARAIMRSGFCRQGSLILFDNEKPICAMVYTRRGNSQVRSLDLAMTHPFYRGQKLAEKLILQSLHILAQNGITTTSLMVTDGNDAAQRLYKKLGFEQSSETYVLKVILK